MSVIEVDRLFVFGYRSSAIHSVGYTAKTELEFSTLYVTWKSDPLKVYTYVGATEDDFLNATKDDGSVRENVVGVTMPLNSLFPRYNTDLREKPKPVEDFAENTESKRKFEVCIMVNGEFAVEVSADSFGDAEKYAKGLFEKAIVTGSIDVKSVTSL